jgi:hypothetical protein
MPKQSYNVSFKRAIPGERIWVHVCSRNGGLSCPVSTWTDDGMLKLELEECPGGMPMAMMPGAAPEPEKERALLAFTRGRKPIWRLLDPKEADQDAPLDVSFEDEAVLRVNLWILAGDFQRQKLRALNAVLLANAILYEENTGVRIEVRDADIIDAVDSAHGGVLENAFPWSDINAVEQQVNLLGDKLPKKRRFEPGVVNVFFTDTIKADRQFHGMHAGDGARQSVALDRFAFDDLLIHELGHALGLGDLTGEKKPGVDEGGLLNELNVMRQFATMRSYFTEGQIIRIHFGGAGPLLAGEDAEAAREWFKRSINNLTITDGLTLAGDLRDGYGEEAFLAVLSHIRTLDRLGQHVTASRARFAKRSRQLTRELKTSFGDGHLPLLVRMSSAEYIASDIIRLFEFYMGDLQTALDGLGPKFDSFKDELLAQIRGANGDQASISQMVSKVFDRLKSTEGEPPRL